MYTREPSRLISTICGPPLSGSPGFAGWAARLTTPPMRNEPVFRGLNGSVTSYWMNSPVPQHDTYKNRSSSERLMSVTSGATALNPCNSGGRDAGSAGSAGISITFLTAHVPVPLSPPSRYQTQMDDERSFNDTTTPTKP